LEINVTKTLIATTLTALLIASAAPGLVAARSYATEAEARRAGNAAARHIRKTTGLDPD